MNRALNLFRASINTRTISVAKNRSCSSVLRVPPKGQSYRSFSQQQNQQNATKVESPKDRAKIRRAYALGGCFIFIWLGTHGILLYRRRAEHRELDRRLPPIPWEEFADRYMTSGQVKSIVYQPSFGTANVYLTLEAMPIENEEMKAIKRVKETLHISPPDKFSRRPDVRFFFEGEQKDLEQRIKDVQNSAVKAGKEMQEVEFSVDQFPSKRELAFIVGSSLFTFAAVALVK